MPARKPNKWERMHAENVLRDAEVARLASYFTTYCNHFHRWATGKPVGHECHVLPPEMLLAEYRGDFERAVEILEKSKPLRVHPGEKRGVNE